MSDLSTPVLPVEKIDVIDGFNVRTDMDPEALEQLAVTVIEAGVRQPIEVREAENGRFELIAGHRRFEAAKKAGLETVPVTLCAGNAHYNALIENLHKEDLNPVDKARGLKAVAGELNLTTNKQIAKRIGKSAEWVGDHLRLLELPEEVQRYIASGEVPIEAERLLRPIAEVSPRIAECVCEVARKEGVKGKTFVTGFGELLRATGQARLKRKPTMLSTQGFTVSEAVSNRKRRKELADRLNALVTHNHRDDPFVHLEEEEIDAARAAGCLVEHRVKRNGFTSVTALVTDRRFAADLVERVVDRKETEARESAERKATQRAAQRTLSQSDEQKEARRVRRADREKKQRKAGAFNERLGVNILRGRTGPRRRQRSLARAQALAELLIADNPSLAARGLRLALPELREVELTPLKKGGHRTKVILADAEQCTKELLGRVRAARTSDQVLEALSEAIAAAHLADEEEIAISKRIHWSAGKAGERVRRLLGPDIKFLRPGRGTRKEAG